MSIKTQKVLKVARAIWSPLAPSQQDSTASDELHSSDNSGEHFALERETLDNLAGQGDLFELSGGSWLPAPLRFVPITPIHHLLEGGMPTRLLPPVLLRALSFHGSFRYVERSVNHHCYKSLKFPFDGNRLRAGWDLLKH